VSTIITGMPSSISAADTENMPVASWPHTIATDDATIVVYQPQAIVWKEYRTLEVRMAVGVTKKGAQKPVLGTLETSVDTHIDFDTRSVVVSNLTLRSSRFPSPDTEQAAAMEQLIQQALVNRPPKHVSLDAILLSLKEKGSETKGVALKNDPPVIFYSAKPANLVVFDSVTTYDSVNATGLDNGQLFPSINAMDKPAVNVDGSIEIHFGPELPGVGKNWIRTLPGHGFFVVLRLYGPTKAFFDKTWKPSDLESMH
jgi:Protein of unknown function (DUF1214)